MQSRKQSVLESTTSTAAGFVVSWAATPLILGAFGYQTTAATAFGVTAVYTALSLVRGYVVRRLFNHWGAR